MPFVIKNIKNNQYVAWYNEYQPKLVDAKRWPDLVEILKSTKGTGLLASFYSDEEDLVIELVD